MYIFAEINLKNVMMINRHVKMEESLWRSAQRIAKKRGLSGAGQLIRVMLKKLIERHDKGKE